MQSTKIHLTEKGVFLRICFWHRAGMTCDHEWTLFCGTLPSGATFRGGYYCDIYGTHAPECPVGGHPFGFPARTCDECKPEQKHLSS